MRHHSTQGEDPEQIGVDPSELGAVNAAHAPNFTKGYWDRTLNHLAILRPKDLKLLFRRRRVPRGIESSIHKAAARAGRRVSVYVRGPAVYIRDRAERQSTRPAPEASHAENRCAVCKKLITPKPGAGKQYVCSGTKKKKSECQKTWRYKQENGVSIEEAKQHRRRRRHGRGIRRA